MKGESSITCTSDTIERRAEAEVNAAAALNVKIITIDPSIVSDQIVRTETTMTIIEISTTEAPLAIIIAIEILRHTMIYKG
jgi:hypothetical protein